MTALGVWTYFASFIPAYSIIAAPLMSQLRKGVTWSEECARAWTEMKRKLASAPIMGYADYSQFSTSFLHHHHHVILPTFKRIIHTSQSFIYFLSFHTQP